MATTEHMGIVLPTRGDAGAGDWDDSIDAALEDKVDGHRHVSGEGRQIPSAGIDIDANLSFAGWVITNAGAIAFGERIAGASPTIPNQSLWVSSADDDLYFRDAGGTDNRLTSGGALNIAIAGGIEGDYAATDASFYYDDANKRFKALQDTGPDYWATVAAGDVQLLEKASGISNAVSLKSPSTLAASYTVTFPAAVPGSTQLVQMSSAGALTASNTIANAVAMSSTLGVTGLITATAGLTAAANQHVTVSGSGEYKHGDRVLNLSPLGSANSVWSHTSGYLVSGSAGTFHVGIPLLQGDRIKSVTFSRYGDAAASFNAATEVNKITSGGVVASLGGGAVLTPPASWADTTYDLADTTLAAGECLSITFSGSAANLRVGTIRVTYDRP